MRLPEHPVPELLAPAGSPDALRAAIAGGADAVYLGVESFNARRGARNFTLESLSEVCRYAHLRGARVYLTVNVIVLPDELEEALQLVDSAWAAGVDAVIVQDLGLIRAVRSTLPSVRLHASTQVNAHNVPTVETLRSLGVSRVTIARETSVNEIATVAAASAAEIECFIHGALCICYSGQCLMSSLVGGRSANRGLCTQPCRLPYRLLTESHAALSVPGAHLLSPKDLAGLAILPRLVASGVSALKIEGRMKSPEYVALVTGVYRAALDRALAHPEDFKPTDGEWSVLEETFSRGFTAGYLVGDRGSAMMSYRRSSNRGVFVGRVHSVEDGLAIVDLKSSLESGDTVEFWTSSGHFSQDAGSLTVDGTATSSAAAGSRVAMALTHSVGAGDRVFRVHNAALQSAAQRTFAESGRAKMIPLDFEVSVVVGDPLRVKVHDSLGRRGSGVGDTVHVARTKTVNAEEVREHVARLGGTPYMAASWSLDLSPNAGIGFSALHQARRRALADYESAVLAPWADRKRQRPSVPSLPPARKERSLVPELVVRVVDLACAQACLAAGADRAIVASRALAGIRDMPPGVVAQLPRIAHDRELPEALERLPRNKRVAVGNLGLVPAASKHGAVVECDWALNVLNVQAVAQLAELGAAFVWLSPELTGRQIAEIAAASPLGVGVAVFGRQEIMVTEHCVLMAEGECNRQCETCTRRSSRRFLRDRKDYDFPVLTDSKGRSHIFNAVPLDLADAIPELASAGVSAVRLDLELDSADEAASRTAAFREVLDRVGGRTGRSTRKRGSGTTSGHYFRGVR